MEVSEMCPFCEGTHIKDEDYLKRCLTCDAVFYPTADGYMPDGSDTVVAQEVADLSEFWTELRVVS